MPGRGGAGGRGRGEQLEMPNQGNRRGGGLGIVDPSGNRRPIGTPPPQGELLGTGLEMPGGTQAPTYNKYRPPTGFSQEESSQWQELDANLKAMDPNQLMDILSTQAGYWHTLAKVIPLLNRAGFDTKLLEDISGLESRIQNQWMMSGAVYDSLKLSGQFSEEELAYFNNMESGPEMLGEFRFLDSSEQRIPACKYIVRHKLDKDASFRLARAVKDYERRREEEREGFLNTPADCMAMKYFRDCVEQQKNAYSLERALRMGLACPELSETARAKLESFLTPTEDAQLASNGVPEVPVPAFDYVRFTDDEIGYRPVGIAGTYGQVDAAGISRVTTTKVSTEFAFFNETGAGHPWMVLPSWRSVAFARSPYGIFVPEISDVAVLARDMAQGMDNSSKKTPPTKDGSGVILVEKEVGALDERKWYIVGGIMGPVEMVPGNDAQGREVLGQVLLVVRPPRRAQGVKEMPLQL